MEAIKRRVIIFNQGQQARFIHTCSSSNNYSSKSFHSQNPTLPCSENDNFNHHLKILQNQWNPFSSTGFDLNFSPTHKKLKLHKNCFNPFLFGQSLSLSKLLLSKCQKVHTLSSTGFCLNHSFIRGLCCTNQTPQNPNDSAHVSPHGSEEFVKKACSFIENQQWEDLDLALKGCSPFQFLQMLLSCKVDAKLALMYFNRAGQDQQTMESSCTLLHILARAKRQKDIKIHLQHIAQRDNHSNSALFHTLVNTHNGYPIKPLIVDILLTVYVESGMLQEAVEAIKRSLAYRIRPSIVSCNAVLNGLVKSRQTKMVYKVYKPMIRGRILQNVRTFNIVIRALCMEGKLQRATDMITDIQLRGCLPDVVTYNTLIDGYCKKGFAGKMYKAQELLNDMLEKRLSPTEVTYNTLIDGYCKEGNMAAAFKMLEKMKEKDLSPNVVTYNALICGLCDEDKVEEAFELHAEMQKKSVLPSIVTYNALINGLCKQGHTVKAEELLDEITEKSLTPNCVTYNTLINGYCKKGEMQEAFRIREAMMNKDMLPEVSTYNALINGFCKNGKMKEASHLLEEMAQKNVLANVITYNILINGVCQQGKTSKAVKLLDEMFEFGFAPNHVTYNTIMNGFCEEGNLDAAFSLRERMEKRGRWPNVATYNILVKGLCRKGRMQDANKLLNEMLERGMVPNHVTYNMVREEMIEKGFVPDTEGHFV